MRERTRRHDDLHRPMGGKGKRATPPKAVHPGPFTAHSAVTCAIVKRGEEVFQSCATIDGARALATLLNHAVTVAEKDGASIFRNAGAVDAVNDAGVKKHVITPAEIVAAAVARAFDWRLELPLDRVRRKEGDAEWKAHLVRKQK